MQEANEGLHHVVHFGPFTFHDLQNEYLVTW